MSCSTTGSLSASSAGVCVSAGGSDASSAAGAFGFFLTATGIAAVSLYTLPISPQSSG